MAGRFTAVSQPSPKLGTSPPALVSSPFWCTSYAVLMPSQTLTFLSRALFTSLRVRGGRSRQWRTAALGPNLSVQWEEQEGPEAALPLRSPWLRRDGRLATHCRCSEARVKEVFIRLFRSS